jgi:hypothetical protein
MMTLTAHVKNGQLVLDEPIVRELEPASDDEEQVFITNLHELNYYFENWPDDPDAPASTPEP